MSTDWLRLKLLSAGKEEDAVLAMDHPTLYNVYAEYWLAASMGQVAPVNPVASYDLDFEKQNFLFEQQKWKRKWKWERSKWRSMSSS